MTKYRDRKTFQDQVSLTQKSIITEDDPNDTKKRSEYVSSKYLRSWHLKNAMKVYLIVLQE